MKRRIFDVALGLAALGVAGCIPTFDDRPWLVEESRVLAVQSTPAEVRPGAAVELHALVVGPQGPSSAVVQWSGCPRPRTSEERGAVTRGCADGSLLEPLGRPAIVPSDACARFGPNPPPTEGDAPAQRPSDPDASGGYHFPVHARATDEGAAAFGFVRLRCDLPNVTRATFEAYEANYTLNENPQFAALSIDGELDDEATYTASAGETVLLEAFVNRDNFEPYVRYDASRARLVDDVESLSLRWYVDDGELDRDLQNQDLATFDEGGPLTTHWQLPEQPGDHWVWAVVADARGGVGWTTARVVVIDP